MKITFIIFIRGDTIGANRNTFNKYNERLVLLSVTQFQFKVSNVDVIDFLNSQSNKSKIIVKALEEKIVNDLQAKTPPIKRQKAIITEVTF